MKERPILFSGAMVRALLAGTKSQTRRIVKQQPERNDKGTLMWGTGRRTGMQSFGVDGLDVPPGVFARCPYGQAGDRLWVRETWAYGIHALSSRNAEREGPWVYGADSAAKQGRLCDRWRPSIHMRREASRITLEVTGVRVERLQGISEADCWAEGIEEVMHDFEDASQVDMAKRLGCSIEDAKPLYAQLWEQINGTGSWAANPWVWVVEFRRLHQRPT